LIRNVNRAVQGVGSVELRVTELQAQILRHAIDNYRQAKVLLRQWGENAERLTTPSSRHSPDAGHREVANNRKLLRRNMRGMWGRRRRGGRALNIDA